MQFLYFFSNFDNSTTLTMVPFIISAQNIAPLRTIKERNNTRDNSQNPSERPLPPSEDHSGTLGQAL